MAGEVAAQCFDHHSLAWRDAAKHVEFVCGDRSSVGVGEKARLIEHQLGHVM